MTGWEGVLVVVAGLAAGVTNAVAGGGSLIAFPALLATGYPPLAANVTNTVALWPGYLAGAASYRAELATQIPRLRRLGSVAAAGGAAGSVILLVAPAGVFEALVPFLVLAAVGLLAAQPRIRSAVQRRPPGRLTGDGSPALYGATFAAAVYGGYFGGGVGVVLLGLMGVFLPEGLDRLNGLKNVLSLVINTIALVGFALFGPVAWGAAALVAPASLTGGLLGARLAKRLDPQVLRRVVIAFGLAVAIRLLVGNYLA